MLLLTFLCFSALAARTPYRIHRGDCEATIGTWRYNLQAFKQRPADSTTYGEIRYITRFCEQGNAFEDSFLMRCHSERCDTCVTQNSLDYKPLNPSNFSEGLIYYADGEPFYDENDELRTVDLEWRIICDPSVTDPAAAASFHVIEGDNLTGLVTGTIRHAAGCPTPGVASPTPTPAYAPNCYFEERYDNDKTKGVKVDLAELNDGPFGVKSVVDVDGVKKRLYFQTCERMACPPGYECAEENLSSAWVCDDAQGGKCVSWGVGVDQPVFKPIDGNLAKGMVLELENMANGHSISLMLMCKAGFPDGHIDWHSEAQVSGQHMDVVGMTSAVCIQQMPSPTPHPIGGPCSFNEEIGGKVISMNIKKFNKGESEGWSKPVSVQGVTGLQDARIMYQPCGAMPCPDDTYCSGDEDASVWLCFRKDGEKLCEGYGLWEHNVSMELWDPERLESGVRARYKGDLKKTADVKYVCNRNLKPDEIVLPGSVQIVQSKMMMVIEAEDACPSSPVTPTPGPETWHPPIPKKGPTATPTPNPSPNPDFVAFNETDYIKLNLDMLVQSDFSGTVELYSGTEENQCNAAVKWQPWKLVTPPNEYPPGEFDLANLWVCWNDTSIGRYCHPVGDRRMDIDMELINKKDYSKGVTLKYRGAYGLDLEVDVLCNSSERDHSIPFDASTKLVYHQTTSGPRILVYSDSSEACPQRYVTPTMPPVPAASPEPSGTPTTYYEITVGGVTRIADFDSMGYLHQSLLVGYDKRYELDMIFFDATKQIACPKGYSCLGTSQKANAWRCINRRDCIPMADVRFGIQYELIDPQDFTKGISATFSGSYADTLTVNCLCDETKYGFRFDELADRTPTGNVIRLTLRSRSFCSRQVKTVTGGAVFLVIFFALGVCYFGGGTLVVYILTGTPNIPNEAFWQSFAASIGYVFTLLLSFAQSLGKGSTTTETDYDKI